MFWELKTERATAQQSKAGAWQVTLDVRARKVVVDEAGVESEVPMDDWIEIGVFGESEGDPYVQQHRVHSGTQTITVTVPNGFVTSTFFLSVVGLKSWGEVTTQYPTQSLLAMAAGMTIPMAAWMLFRGMGRRNAYEMAAAMLLPVIPFLCLVWFDVTESAQCGIYCASTLAAMLGVMFYRRDAYSLHGHELG